MILEPKRISCPSCTKDTGFTDENLSGYVIPQDGLKCPHCQAIVIRRTEAQLNPIIKAWEIRLAEIEASK